MGNFAGLWVDFDADGYLAEGRKGNGLLISKRQFSGGLFGS